MWYTGKEDEDDCFNELSQLTYGMYKDLKPTPITTTALPTHYVDMILERQRVIEEATLMREERRREAIEMYGDAYFEDEARW